MTQKLTKEKAKLAIDVLLADKPDDFRAAVFQLCHQLNWDDDEPGFLVGIATNQLEALIRQYPERISEAMAEAAHELKADWQILQAKLNLTAMKSAQTATQIDTRSAEAQRLIHQELVDAKQVMADERAAMLLAMKTEREAVQKLLTDERTALATQAHKLAEDQKAVLAAHTKDLIAQGVLKDRDRVGKQVKEIVASARTAHLWQSFGFACASALGFVFLILALVNLTPWGRLRSWNQDQIKACRDVDLNTCNIHIKRP